MKKNKSLLISCLILYLWSCQAKHAKTMIIPLPNDKEFTIWSTPNLIYDNGEKYDFKVSYDLIELMPMPIKTIIARYTAFLPSYLLDEHTELEFAQALGGFSTLEEARNVLLKDWSGEDLGVRSYFPASLIMKKTKESLFFEYCAMYGDKITDEFKISESGKISYLKQPEPIENISYNRKTLLNECGNYRFLLNGEPIEHFTFLYLDADNIKSVGINKRDHIVYIEQINKNPKYFVRSDLSQYLDSLAAFKVQSIDEIDKVFIQDETINANHYDEFYESCKIETSAIKSIRSFILSNNEYETKCVAFVLKK
ncbi:MAG: hypothetical protein FWF52_09460 [Candidatus Azobacteroides sp.]|nr:hypothetical protein [Candidatus Azobacteroides sp.]